MSSETEIGKTIDEIKSLWLKIIEENNGEIPDNMPGLEIEMPVWQGDV